MIKEINNIKISGILQSVINKQGNNVSYKTFNTKSGGKMLICSIKHNAYSFFELVSFDKEAQKIVDWGPDTYVVIDGKLQNNITNFNGKKQIKAQIKVDKISATFQEKSQPIPDETKEKLPW